MSHLGQRDPYGSQDRRQRKMARIDALTPEQRLLVHEVGWNLVKCFMEKGVTSPREIRALVSVVLNDLAPPWHKRGEKISN